ncbi:hypothetical protein [Nonomuraea sp. NPDC049400]|uniref:hypothetical protein n=1 Tax=Nonomuraea sp. NPDC049400 TaxID=3364352 RepID=UPI0037B73563
MKRTLHVVVSAIVVTGAGAAMPAAAHAGGYGCNGSLVGTWRLPMKDAYTGEKFYISDIKLYYNASSGWNCAVLAKRPDHQRYGTRTPMDIAMYNSRFREDNVKNNYDYDYGRFKYFAGPVRVYGKNMCVSIVAQHADTAGPFDGKWSGSRRIFGAACD